jgi:hypothetical protein
VTRTIAVPAMAAAATPARATMPPITAILVSVALTCFIGRPVTRVTPFVVVTLTRR